MLCIWSLQNGIFFSLRTRASIWRMCIVENSLQFQCASDWKFNEIHNKFTFPPLISFPVFFFLLILFLLSYKRKWFIENALHFCKEFALSADDMACNLVFSLLILAIWNFMSIFYESCVCLKCQLTLCSVCFVIFLRTSFQTFLLLL